jgi:hypothetical protein
LYRLQSHVRLQLQLEHHLADHDTHCHANVTGHSQPNIDSNSQHLLPPLPSTPQLITSAAAASYRICLHCRHNSHHAFPQSARHGLEWYEIDLTWYVICALKALGIVWDVHVPSEKAKALKRLKPAPIKLTAKAH